MADVDPFLHDIPSQFLEDRETRNFFEYLVRWAHDMWIRTGGGDDIVADNQDINTGDNAVLAQLAALRSAIDEINQAPRVQLSDLEQRIHDLEQNQ